MRGEGRAPDECQDLDRRPTGRIATVQRTDRCDRDVADDLRSRQE